MNFLRVRFPTETSAEPSLQAKQLQLKRARLADDLNDKISHRPGPIELVHKNILSVDCPLQHSLLGSYRRCSAAFKHADRKAAVAAGAVAQLSASFACRMQHDCIPAERPSACGTRAGACLMFSWDFCEVTQQVL